MLCQIMVEFQFDGKSQLIAVQTSQRILLPPTIFSADQLSRPWIPAPTQDD